MKLTITEIEIRKAVSQFLSQQGITVSDLNKITFDLDNRRKDALNASIDYDFNQTPASNNECFTEQCNIEPEKEISLIDEEDTSLNQKQLTKDVFDDNTEDDEDF